MLVSGAFNDLIHQHNEKLSQFKTISAELETQQGNLESVKNELKTEQEQLRKVTNDLSIKNAREQALGEQYFETKNQLTDCQKELQNQKLVVSLNNLAVFPEQLAQKNGSDVWSKTSGYTVADCYQMCNKYSTMLQVTYCESGCDMYGKPSKQFDNFMNERKKIFTGE
ncbi:MAG TPA: hypothetical protein VJJ82_02020 [Candidatus Nanoarchaeia archaeon]|nr:hypothetical protein [Candidatus Nanoarchaeia archaeon]